MFYLHVYVKYNYFIVSVIEGVWGGKRGEEGGKENYCLKNCQRPTSTLKIQIIYNIYISYIPPPVINIFFDVKNTLNF